MVNLRFALAALLALSIPSLRAAPPEQGQAAVTVPPLPFEHATLPNGLQVYSVEDHSSPTVAVQVWYHVGSKDDPKDRSGFAHLFEHMMFKGNEHLTPDTLDELTENVGGENNAYTADDVTVYYEVIPANYLEPILWVEAERMSALSLNEPNFNSEREVVKEEYRQRILANPYGELHLATVRNSYRVHPYQRPGIGSMADLDAAKLPEVKAFHSTFYRPDNASLVVVGDFQPNELKSWLQKYLAAVPKPSTPIPRVTVKEPPRAEEKKVVLYNPKAPLPAVAITYLAPSIRSDDAPALELASEILAGGDSSRLYQSLIYRQQIAQQVSFDADLKEDLGLITARIILATGKSPTQVEQAFSKEVENVLQQGVSDAELEKAKTRFLTGKLLERETKNGKAGALGQAAVLYGDPNRVNTDFAKLEAVTTSQVKEVLARYLSGKKKVLIEYLPEAMKAATRQKEEKKS